jgi:hypothetical protein
MRSRQLQLFPLGFLVVVVAVAASFSQTDSPSSSSKHVRKPAASADSLLDMGSVTNGIYHNRALGFSCTIPPGWVLRTEEMNAGDQNEPGDGAPADPQKSSSTSGKAGETGPARVLLAAFSRPPQAAGEDINSSILIAAEKVAAYPGLKEAVQYFEPLTEVAKVQGFTVIEEPYEMTIGSKAMAREDFQKNVGSRVMRQSTLVMLVHGYAISFTFITGTEDEAEDLINGLSFDLPRNTGK